MSDSKGRIFVISAPSGSGKTTLLRRFLRNKENVCASISATTRPPRDGEMGQKDYIFLTKDEFEEKISKDEFVEWTQTYGHYYGTPTGQIKKALDSGKSIVLNIDVVGAKNIRKKYPQAVLIFIRPPSVETLEDRLNKRGLESEAEIEKRLKQAKSELSCESEYDHIVVNDDLERALKEFEQIIGEHIQKPSKKGAI